MKKISIIIIIIALILTLGCVGTFAFLYFATETFKSEQEMFYKYASQIDLKEFIDLESYNAYSERLKTAGHTNEGEFSIEISQGEEVTSESIKYNGYSNPLNKTSNYDISINKDNETLLAMNYLNIQDFYGLQFKDVVNQYVVFENNNLKEFAAQMGVLDTSEIPNKIEIPEGNISNINYEEILNTYLNIAIEEIPEDNYSKIKKQDISLGNETIEADGYQVKLKVKDIQKILKKVLENARDDEQIYNLIKNEQITFEDYQETIDELIEGLSEEVPKEENIEFITISVYKQGKNTVKLSLELAIEEAEVDVEISIENTAKGMMIKFVNIQTNYDETKTVNSVTITKTANFEEQENFEIIVIEKNDEEQKELSRINLSRNGLLTSNNVVFDLSIITNLDMSLYTEESVSLKIGMKNSTNFAAVPKEGKFEQGNHVVINGLSPEQITNLFTNLGKILGEKLKDEMFISMTTSINRGLFETAQQAQQQMQNALEQESQLESGMLNINGEIHSIDEYAPSDYRPVMPDNTSSETQSSNESTMSQMFSEGQEFLNN